ncbi:MAG TPA: HlyD family efflux transporter periplasmic adaptor subunit, partial [Candidatus Limnocylindrales bacterium]
GDVRAAALTVTAPAISYPTVSYTVQVLSNAAQGKHVATFNESGITGGQALVASRTPGVPVISGTLSTVNVRVGDHVTTGTVLAQLDTKMLDLGVQQAKNNATKTKTTVSVLNNGINTVLDNIDKLATGRAALTTGKAALATAKAKIAAGEVQLAKAKATLLKAKAGLLAAQKSLLEARANRAQLEATLAGLKQQAATYPPGQVPASLQAKIAQLEGLLASINPGLAKIDANLKQVNAGLAKIAAGQAQLTAAKAQLATGAAKLATAQAQLATAADALHTAKTQVYKARDYVRIIANGANVGVVLADAKRDQATLISPVSGTVTQAPVQGTVAVVGAPLVRIQPDGPALVDTYVPPEQLAKVRVGMPADITYDSAPGKVLRGTLMTIASDAQYPPTSFPTDVVHMTRTVKLTFRIDSGDTPPAGTPVDIAIHTD